MRFLFIILCFSCFTAVAADEIPEEDALVEKILSGAKDLPTQIAGLSVNETIKIPGRQWVDVVKPIMNHYSNGSSMLEKGENCGIKYEGSVEILGFSPEGEKALLEYSSPGDDLGTPCPSGALFFISTEELASFEERYAERVHREEQRDALVEKILSGADDLPTQVASLSVNEAINVPGWQWVDVVKPIMNHYSNGSSMLEKGENCGIKYEGSVEILGFSPEGEKALLEYSSPGDDLGTPCPSGALFFISTEELASFEERYAERVHREEQRDALVEKILSGAKDLPTQVADLSVNEATHIPEWQWINVVKPIENQYSNGSSMLEKGEKCGIQGGGSIAILGFSPEGEKALLEYSSPGDDLGTPCPSGAVFFLSTEELALFEGQWWKVETVEVEESSLWDKIAALLRYRITL